MPLTNFQNKPATSNQYHEGYSKFEDTVIKIYCSMVNSEGWFNILTNAQRLDQAVQAAKDVLNRLEQEKITK